MDVGGGLSRTYTGVPAHDILLLEVKFYIIDTWNRNEEGIKLTVDGNPYELWLDVGATSDWSSNICGGAANDMGVLYMRAKIYHSASSVTFRFEHGLPVDANSGSWGFRDFKVVFGTMQAGELEEVCGYAPTNILRSKVCGCPEG